MSQGLVYTSAPQGLNPGARGFCTVAASEALGKRERLKLENLSGYEFAFNLSDDQPERNPTNYLHTQVMFGSERREVLSRVAYSGADYSNRTNKIAHHVLLGPSELVAPGPAWALERLERGHFVKRWDEDPRALDDHPLATLVGGGRGGAGDPLPCEAWAQATGDAGWGGALARAFYRDPNTPAFVVFEPGLDLLALLSESLALLPPEERWRVCFATYYTGLPPDVPCHWRGVLAGSKAAGQVRRFPGATVIDLTTSVGAPPDDVYTAAARDGRRLPPPGEIVDEPIELVDPGAADAASFGVPQGHWAELGLKPPTASRHGRSAGPNTAPWIAVGVVGVVVAIGLALLWPSGPSKRIEVIPKLETKTLARTGPLTPRKTTTEPVKTVAKTTPVMGKTVAKTAAKTDAKTDAPDTPPKVEAKPPSVRTVRLERLPRTLIGEATRNELIVGYPDGAAWVFEIPDGGVTHVLEAPKGAPLRFQRDGDALLVGVEVMEQLVGRFEAIARVSARASKGLCQIRLEAVRGGDPELRGLLPLLVLELLNEKTGSLYPIRAQPPQADVWKLAWTPADGFVAPVSECVFAYPLAAKLRLVVRIADKRSTLEVRPDGKTRGKSIRSEKDALPVTFTATRDAQELRLVFRANKLLAALNAAIRGWDPAELFGLRKKKARSGDERKRLAELEVAEAQVTGLIQAYDGFELTVRDAWGLPLRRLVIQTRWAMPAVDEEGR